MGVVGKLELRRTERCICSQCRSPDYKMTPNDIPGGKPNFTCGSCGNVWQFGKDGGKYARLA